VLCLIISIIVGIVVGVINCFVSKEQCWCVGILGGMLCESLTMLLIVLWVKPMLFGLIIVLEIVLLMIFGVLSIGLIVLSM
ncbi:sensor histidine kinase, partial [Bacillus sp. MBGLi97]